MKRQDRILIFDPFKNLLSIYRMFLEAENYRIETASRLSEASQKLLKDRYAVLISEFLPPFEETFQIIERVKEQSPETYVLIVTDAMLDELTYKRLFDIGVDDLVLKPYPFPKILAHVKKGLRIRDLILKERELEERVLTDPITSAVGQPVFNFFQFKRCLRQEMKRAKRYRHPLSLLLIEIPDKEKTGGAVNGFYVELIRLLRNNTREEDNVGRENGGFGILLPETDKPGSQALTERLLRLIRSHHGFQDDNQLRLLAQTVFFCSFTYPEGFLIPERLRSTIEDLLAANPRPM